MAQKVTILSVEHIRSHILNLHSKHDPSQVDGVDESMKKWKGKENDLLKSLCDRYKEPFTPMKAIGIKEQYSIGSKLGTGGFAVVCLCKDRTTELAYALKIVNKKTLDKEDLAILDREVQIMRKVHHFNIVKMHNVFDSNTKMCLVLDLLEGGELFDRIIAHGHFTEKNAAECFRQLVEALDYLHKKNIVHRDLKPENLLFTKKCAKKDVYVPEEWNMKLIDFGLAGVCGKELLTTPCGTPNYVAPEILRKEKYGPSVDMWSGGVILYIILCGFPPFYDEHEDLVRLYGKIKKGQFDMPKPYWDAVSAEAKDLVNKLLVTDPAKRLTAAQTLQHPWLQGKASDLKMSDERRLQLKRFQMVRSLRRGVRCILAVLRLMEALNPKET